MAKLAPVVSPGPISGQPFRDDDPLFTVIVTDYEPSVPRDFFRRKMACLAAQTCNDFEVLVYHDGPKSQSYAEDLSGGPMHPATKFIETPARVGDWGHAARDLGIRAARGRWIIHTNADNIFYPHLIATLKDVLVNSTPWVFIRRASGIDLEKSAPRGLRRLGGWLQRTLGRAPLPPQPYHSADPQILIYGIVVRCCVHNDDHPVRLPVSMAAHQGVIMGGVPAVFGRIDAMQLVMQRALWLAEGGWYDRREASDGMLYPEFAMKYRVLAIPALLGEHW